MLIIPAIDLKDHKVVRLTQGKFQNEKIYSESPLAMAEHWIGQGATRLHIVDLNGALEGKRVHHKDIKEISQVFPSVQLQVGGGIRSLEVIEDYFEHGVDFCILGTVAVKDPAVVFRAAEKFPGHIILGIDAKKGMVATDGWGQKSGKKGLEVARQFEGQAIESVIYTDISRDGMLSGINFNQTKLMKDCGFPLIASGGLSSIEDIKTLVQMKDVFGVIAGKALYEGRVDYREAVECVNK